MTSDEGGGKDGEDDLQMERKLCSSSHIRIKQLLLHPRECRPFVSLVKNLFSTICHVIPEHCASHQLNIYILGIQFPASCRALSKGYHLLLLTEFS